MTRRLVAAPCAPGTAAGPAWWPRATTPDDQVEVGRTVRPAEVQAAFAAVADELTTRAEAFRENGAREHADLLETTALIARDPSFAGGATARLGAGATAHEAEAAVAAATDELSGLIAALDSPELRERATDIRHVGRLVADMLAGRSSATAPDTPFVLVGADVAAPDLLEHADRVVAAVSTSGGPAAHAAIVARSLGIPLVCGVAEESLPEPGRPVLVDGDLGEVVVEPPADEVAARTVAPAATAAAAHGAVHTRDGDAVTLLANVASAAEARRAIDAGADGVGLLRTELPFLLHRDWPTEAEHAERLAPVLEVLGDRPVTVRLLDFSNDKTPPFLDPGSSSPLARLLSAPGALDAQLRALLRLSRGRDVRVLVPMVRTSAELAEVRRRLARAAVEVGADTLPPVGAMVELPETVDVLPDLVPCADFFSIGSNDLSAATLAVERTDPALSPASVAEPAVLRLVGAVVERAGGRPVSLCGDAAGDPQVLPLLVGAGLRAFSVAPPRLPEVRARLAALDSTECATEYEAALAAARATAAGRPGRG